MCSALNVKFGFAIDVRSEVEIGLFSLWKYSRKLKELYISTFVNKLGDNSPKQLNKATKCWGDDVSFEFSNAF